LTDYNAAFGYRFEKINCCHDFSVLHLEQKEIQLKFDSPLSVLKHLKETGVTATNNQIWNYKKVAQFCEQYRQQYADEQGYVSLTYVPILMLAQKKEER